MRPADNTRPCDPITPMRSPVRHEEVGPFAAGAEAHLTGYSARFCGWMHPGIAVEQSGIVHLLKLELVEVAQLVGS